MALKDIPDITDKFNVIVTDTEENHYFVNLYQASNFYNSQIDLGYTVVINQKRLDRFNGESWFQVEMHKAIATRSRFRGDGSSNEPTTPETVATKIKAKDYNWVQKLAIKIFRL